MNESSNEKQHEHAGYGLYFGVWLVLLALTAITVTVAGLDLGKVAVTVAIVIAAAKSTIVVMFFMHLKYEMPLFTIMLIVCLLTYAIFIGLTFFDPLFR